MHASNTIECGEGNEFDSIDGNYTCKDSTLVSSFASEPGTIPPVEIFTDYRWALLTDGDLCKFYKEDSTAAPTVLDDGDGFNVPPASFFNDTTPTTSSSNSSSSIDSPAQAPLAMPVTAAPTTLVNASSLTNPPTQFTNDSSSQEEQATSSSSSSSATKAIYPVAAAVLLLLCRLESS
mgnify:CR=1 FL=1